MIGVVKVLARVTPSDVHLTSGQVDHHGIDGLHSGQRIVDIHRVITDRSGEIDKVTLDGLQGLDVLLVLAFDQPQGVEVTHAGGNMTFPGDYP